MSDEQSTPASVNGTSTQMVIDYVERVEQVEARIADFTEDRKEVYKAAKDDGLDVPALREIIKRRKKTESEVEDHEMLVETYLVALGMRD